MVVAFFLQATERELLGWVLAVFLYSSGTLDKHAAGSTGRVEYRTAFGIEHVGNQ